ncbi:MAG: hypothetical protein L0Z73_13210 [Gammaproteobacteria bacterium]|nr:hypothetical protein [Gammaproteobacteria bacterium]
MVTTSRIASGFDIELQLGGRWFFTAINLLNEHGLLAPPGLPVIISNVQISFETGWDLQIDIIGFPEPIFARAILNEAGTELILTTSMPGVPERRIPFGALKDLAAPPVLVKLQGDAEHEPVLAVLANLNIQAGPQNEDPSPEGEFLARGNADNAQSFLPLGEDIAFGMARETFSRFANNIWHTNLRAEDGTHPLPDAENKKGAWSRVTMAPENGRIRLKLEGDIPVDSPLIDMIPDPHVTITLLLIPTVIDGKLSFSIETETDVDTGLLGDIFGGIAGGILGGIVGFVVGLFTGGILAAVLIGAGIGFVAGIIVIEIAEVVVEGIVQKEIKAKIDGENLPDIHCCKDGIAQIATPPSGGFNLSVLDAIPSSIAIFSENPEDELLYKRSLLVTSIYEDLVVNASGFGVAGSSGTAEKYQPEIVSLAGVRYAGETLASLTYERDDGEQQELSIQDVFARAASAELKAPFKILQEPEDASLRIPEGQLACVCLKPVAIQQEDTVVQVIEFENGIRIRVADAVALQDAAAIIVKGYQLIHPRDYNAYYRAKADFFEDNNFESLPKF